MKLQFSTVLPLLAVAIFLAGCKPTPKSRYYLQTEQIPEGTVTSVVDRKLNTQLLYIAELNSAQPSINLLPVSRLDIKDVSVDSMGQDDVFIVYEEEDKLNRHTVHINETPQPRSSTHWNSDTNKDGQVDMRAVRFRTDLGYIQYFDFDANGILDAQFSMAIEGDHAPEARILVDSCWISIEGDSEAFHDAAPKVTSKEEPPIVYHFQKDSWRKTEAPTTPQ